MLSNSNQKGFIQFPIIIAVLFITSVFGIGLYFQQEKKTPLTNNEVENNQNKTDVISSNISKGIEATDAISTGTAEELIMLKNEIEALKINQQKNQTTTKQIIEKTQVIEKPIKTPQPTGNIHLTNSQIIEKVKSAVVYIQTSQGAGSGFIIDNDGYILTNAHVVEGVSGAQITLTDGRIFIGNVIGRDEKIDLALLKISITSLYTATLGDSSETVLKQGDEIFTFGYPFGLKGEVSFKEGTISRRYTYNDLTYLEMSAEIHPGNSGGPLVNIEGSVVGINTIAYSDKSFDSIKWAIPINIAKEYIPLLKAGRNIVKLNEAKTSTSQIAFFKLLSDQQQNMQYNSYEPIEIKFQVTDGFSQPLSNISVNISKDSEKAVLYTSDSNGTIIYKLYQPPALHIITLSVGNDIKSFTINVSSYSKNPITNLATIGTNNGGLPAIYLSNTTGKEDIIIKSLRMRVLGTIDIHSISSVNIKAGDIYVSFPVDDNGYLIQKLPQPIIVKDTTIIMTLALTLSSSQAGKTYGFNFENSDDIWGSISNQKIVPNSIVESTVYTIQ